MLTYGLLGVVAAYTAVAVLLLSLNVASRWLWWVKGSAIVATGFLFATTYISVAALIGWPTEEAPPRSFQLHWSKIVEPNQFTQNPGAIYLWLEELDENNIPIGVPRSYKLPYDDQLADQLLAANEKIKEGEEVAGSVNVIEGEAEEEEDAEPMGEENLELAERGENPGGGFLPENFDPDLLTLTLQEMPEIIQPDKSPF